MRHVASTILLCLLPTLCQDAERASILGRWVLGYREPGVVEPRLCRLEVIAGEASAVTAELSIPGRSVPFEGTFDEAKGKLTLAARSGSRTARLVLWIEGARLRGEGDLLGTTLEYEGWRTDEEPRPPEEVDFDVPRALRFANDALPARTAEDCRAAIAELMAERPIVGLSAAFVSHGEVVDVLDAGWEDFGTRVPTSAKTRYRWASVSKPLTAVAALQLAAAGDLDLDADVREYVPEYDKGAVITARQLLEHRSGVPHYDQMRVHTIKEYDDPHPWADRIVALDIFVESELVRPPGSGFHYSTPGYVLLGAVIERAGAGGYVEQVEARICKPLGMTSMRPDSNWVDIPHRASAYQYFGDRALRAQLDDTSWKLPAGGWISTVEDMGRFAAGLMGPGLIDEGTKARMCHLPDPLRETYTQGVRVQRFRGEVLLSHSGGQVGASTYLLCCPATGHGVAVAANTEGIGLSGVALRLLGLLMDSEN